MIKINNLKSSINNKEILKGINLEIKKGEVHAIMGPNGSGKSTLSKIITGHPDFRDDVSGEIFFNNEDILSLEPDEISQKGIFLAFQYPVEIPGVNNEEFLRLAYNTKRKKQNLKELDPIDFSYFIEEKLSVMKMDESFLERSVNHGFSGGEKKRNEILQLLVLDPSFVILDEPDSGLDIDSLKIVADAVNYFKNENKSILLITHYQRILNYIHPDVVHVLIDGKIQKTGDKKLVAELEEKGYDWVAR